jgi:hypothetical protein
MKDHTLMMIHKCLKKQMRHFIIGDKLNLVRGYWQVSRVHVDATYFYGISGVELCKAEGFGDFDIAFAYESVARAEKCRGNSDSMNSWFERGQAVAENIGKEQDEKYLLSELTSIHKG